MWKSNFGRPTRCCRRDRVGTDLPHLLVSTQVWLYLALAFGTAGSSTTWVHTTELYSTDIRSTAHTLAFIVGRFGGFASGYVVENANSIPFATTVLIIMAALSALGTLTLRETMGERLS